MTTLRTAAQQALEALEYHVEQTRPIWKTSEAIAALEAALAEPVQEPFCYVYEYDSPYGLHREFYPREYNGMKPSRTVALYAAPHQPPAEPVQEPVAKVDLMTTGGNAGLATRIVEIDDHLRERLRPGQLLYTAPPQRKPLTREEAIALWADKSDGPSNGEIVSFARAIERAHGIV